MKTLYLPIASHSLGHYFSKGCLCPTKYISNRNEDVQNLIENGLLLCKRKYTPETNCSLEVVFTSEEEIILKEVNNEFYIFPNVLPISRVKRIYFNSEEQKKRTVWNINDGSAFIPDTLVQVDTNNDIADIKALHTFRPNLQVSDLSEKINLYNQVMGGFACMRFGGESWMEYSYNYFSTLALLNGLIGEEIRRSSFISDKKYDWSIIESNKFTELRSAIYSRVNFDVVESFAKKDGVKIEKKLGNIRLDKIKSDSTTYLVAILASFGEGSRKKIDDFISEIVSDKFPPARKEGISLIFGINKGYEGFRNKYHTANFALDVKFRLDSQVDYYTIESIYQFVFNNNQNNYSFPYIDNWCPKSKSTNSNNKYECYRILDKDVMFKKKESDSGYLQELLQDFSTKALYKKIASTISDWFPSCFQSNKKDETELYFEEKLKSLLVEIIEKTYKKAKADIKKENETEKLIAQEKIKELESELKNTNKKQLELLQTNEALLHELNTKSNQNIASDNTESSYLQADNHSTSENSSQQLDMGFPPQTILNDSDNNNSSKKDIREKELSKETRITELRKIAKKAGIKRKFENTDEDKDRLRKLVIEKEFGN